MQSSLPHPSSGLHGSLSSTLRNVLVDLNQQSSTNHHHLASTSLPPTVLSMASSLPGLIPATFHRNRFPSALLQQPNTATTSSNPLLAVLAHQQQSQQLLQQKMALLQKQLLLVEQEKKRILLAQSSKKQPQQDNDHHEAPPMAKEALQVLGRSLRKAADPYIDAAQLSQMSDTDDNKNGKKQPRKARGGVTDPFPDKLHRMLSDGDNKHSDIVSFLPHGRAFYVHDMDRFVSQVMPQYFKQTKWTSFARQLSLWGFQRIRTGPDAGAYYHELFLRGRPQLVEHMRRVGVPQAGQQDRRKSRQQDKSQRRVEPNFYAMQAL